MTTFAYGNWIVDFLTKSCWNSVTNVTVSFDTSETAMVGRIKHAPSGLLKKWLADPSGKQYFKNIVSEAKEIYLKAYIDNYAMYFD